MWNATEIAIWMRKQQKLFVLLYILRTAFQKQQICVQQILDFPKNCKTV